MGSNIALVGQEMYLCLLTFSIKNSTSTSLNHRLLSSIKANLNMKIHFIRIGHIIPEL